MEVFTLACRNEIEFDASSLETDVKVHVRYVNAGDLKRSREEMSLTSEKLTVDKNQRIA